MAEELKIFPSGKGTQKKNFFKIPAYIKSTLGDVASKATHVKKDGTLFTPQALTISKKLEKPFVHAVSKNKDLKNLKKFAISIMKKTSQKAEIVKENKVNPIARFVSKGGR